MDFSAGNISKADAAAYSSSDSDNDGEDDLTVPSADPRADDFADFNPRKRRRTGRDAKESAALGIFGSDSEEDGPARKWKRKQDLRHKNLSFISAGQKKLDEEDEDNDDEYAEPTRFGLGTKDAPIEDGDEDMDEEDEAMTGAGLGFRASGQGLGWAPPSEMAAAPATVNTPSRPSLRTKYDGSTPLGQGFVPSSAKGPVLRDDLPDTPSSVAPAPKPSAFGGGSGGNKNKSFAARMMAKMGYVEGQGLGAEGQGRNIILEASLRPMGAGLGAVKEKSKQEREEEKRQARLRGEEVIDSDDEGNQWKQRKKEERKKLGLDSGTASGASTPRRPKTKYLTVNDVRKAAPGLHIPDAFAPILDMTGPGHKMLTSSSGIMTPTAGSEVAEQTEAKKLASRAQRDLSAFVEEWKTLEERKAWLDMETHQRQQELDEFETQFARHRIFASVLDEVEQAARDKQWDPVVSSLRRTAEAGPVTESDELASVAVAAVHPFLRDATQGWQPLDDPKLGNFVADITSIKSVLGLESKMANGTALARWEDQQIDGTHRHHQKSTTPYESMVYLVIFPKLVTAIAQQWDVHDATPLLAFFESWDALLPSFVRAQLLNQVVARLDGAISEWKPRKKSQNLPHLWVFPWLQHLSPHHLDPKGTGIVSDVRRKFRQLIDVWEFDRGLIPGLKQWKDVFRPSKSQDQWKPLVMHHVLPSMARYLKSSFRVDPSDQEPYLPMLTGVLRWTEIIAPSMVAEVIVAEIFPLWHEVLWQWLTSDEANYEEVGAWFEWWQDQVLADIKDNESIAAELEKGTKMIEQALDLGDESKRKLARPNKTPARESGKTKSHHEHHKHHDTPSKTDNATLVDHPRGLTSAHAKEKTFRDEVEDWCNDNDLRFIPTHKSTDHGEKYIRVTARMDGKGGVMTYFKKIEAGQEIFVVESRKLNMEFRREKESELGILADVLFRELEEGRG